DAGGSQSVHQRLAKQIPARAVVAPDGYLAADAVCSEIRRVCPSNRARRFRREIPIDDAADVVLSKDSGCDGHGSENRTGPNAPLPSPRISALGCRESTRSLRQARRAARCLTSAESSPLLAGPVEPH